MTTHNKIKVPFNYGQIMCDFTSCKSGGLRTFISSIGFKVGAMTKPDYLALVSLIECYNDSPRDDDDLMILLEDMEGQAKVMRQGWDNTALVSLTRLAPETETETETKPAPKPDTLAEGLKKALNPAPVMPESLLKYGVMGQEIFDAVIAGASAGLDIAKVEEICNAMIAGQPARRIEITIDQGKVKEIKTPHAALEKCLNFLSMRKATGDSLNLYVWGPVASGKSTLAKQIAHVYGIDLYVMGCTFEPTDLTGYKSVDGTFIRTRFLDMFEAGGVLLWDEYDRSSAVAVQVINDALANGVYFDITGRKIMKHKDFYLIASGNTPMTGSTGRHEAEKQDAAIRDRFIFVHIPYDEMLEKTLAPHKGWYNRVISLRRAVERLHVDIDVSPRATYDGGMFADSMGWEDLEDAFIFKGLPKETADKIRANA